MANAREGVPNVLPATIPKTPLITSLNPVMRVPSHGHGLLRQGGTNRGGPGRPPSALKASMRQALDERIHIAEDIADDPLAESRDRLRALEFLAKYALGDGEAPEVPHRAIVISYGEPPLEGAHHGASVNSANKREPDLP